MKSTSFLHHIRKFSNWLIVCTNVYKMKPLCDNWYGRKVLEIWMLSADFSELHVVRLCQNSELVGQYFWFVIVTCEMLKINRCPLCVVARSPNVKLHVILKIKENKNMQHIFLMKIFMIIVVKWYKSVTKLSLFKNCIHLVANAENNLELECISYVCTAPYLGSMSCQLSTPIIRSSLLAFFSTKKRTVADKSLV